VSIGNRVILVVSGLQAQPERRITRHCHETKYNRHKIPRKEWGPHFLVKEKIGEGLVVRVKIIRGSGGLHQAGMKSEKKVSKKGILSQREQSTGARNI